MASELFFGVALLLSACLPASSDLIPDGVVHVECHDRFFVIAVDLSFAGEGAHFEVVDGTAVHLITEEYAAKCGYSVSVLPLRGRVELRASYFSCHTDNDDEVFTFSFNLIVTHEGKEVTYPLGKTCSPSLPWSPREITCEVNYMEVSMQSEVPCPSEPKKDDWDAAEHANGSIASEWQVVFQSAKEQTFPMTLSEAHKQGYTFVLTNGRLVFRTPYGQPDSLSTEVNGVPVEVVHATLFSRQSWVVLMVDLVAACSMHEGSFDNGYMMWETPEVLHPLMASLHNARITISVDGELVEEPITEQSGYTVEKNTTVQISIPYKAGGFRKSSVVDDLYEFYTFNLHLEQILVDEDLTETRVTFHRTLVTPMFPHPIFTTNQTVLEERVFTVYLGSVPEDVEMAAVSLNGQTFTVPFTNTSSRTISKVVHPNNTHGYTLKVPFDDPVVTQQLSKEESLLQYKLDINYTLTVIPENEFFHHLSTIVALFTDVSPPVFDAVCSESGISFRLDHRPSDYMWYITIGSDLLTSELATQHGYIMSNDSQSLLLEVPLYTQGYEYKDITLRGFLGTFEILVRDRETSEVQSSSVKTCPFTTNELIMCSTDGRMTVVADLSRLLPSGGNPARTNLLEKYCVPKEADDTRALFSFPLNSCGSIVKLGKENVTYQNEILYSKKYLGVGKGASEDANERVIVQCTYSLAGLHRLFSVYRFESDTVGLGKVIHIPQSTAEHQIPTIKPTTALHVAPTRGPSRAPNPSLPAVHHPVHYIRVTRVQNHYGIRKGAEGTSQVKVNAAQIGR